MLGTLTRRTDQSDLIRYGTYKGKQIWLDKATGIRYTDNGALPGRQTPPQQVGAALMAFYDGMSITQVARHQEPIFDTNVPSKATIYEWVKDYTALGKAKVADDRPHTGDRWVCDELVTRIGGEKMWVWTVMDIRTRYILASHISRTRTITDVRMLFSEAAKRAAKLPKTILTDKMTAYPDGIERVFGRDVKHVQSEGMTSATNNNLAERLMGTIRARTKIMRGMKSLPTAQMVMDGWDINYNYFRPHMALKGKTPAHVAQLEHPFKNWEDMARLDVREFSHKRARLERERLLEARPLRERRPRARLRARL